VDRNIGRPITQDRKAYSWHYPVLISSLEETGRSLILATGFACAVDGYNQDLMVVE
jgi:hypothetical protein